MLPAKIYEFMSLTRRSLAAADGDGDHESTTYYHNI
jgi:hypothetical protein